MTKLVKKGGQYQNENTGRIKVGMPTNSIYKIKRRTTRTII